MPGMTTRRTLPSTGGARRTGSSMRRRSARRGGYGVCRDGAAYACQAGERHNLQQTSRIRGYGNLVISGIVEIGRELVAVKERVGHGRYTGFVTERLRWSICLGARDVEKRKLCAFGRPHHVRAGGTSRCLALFQLRQIASYTLTAIAASCAIRAFWSVRGLNSGG